MSNEVTIDDINYGTNISFEEKMNNLIVMTNLLSYRISVDELHGDWFLYFYNNRNNMIATLSWSVSFTDEICDIDVSNELNGEHEYFDRNDEGAIDYILNLIN